MPLRYRLWDQRGAIRDCFENYAFNNLREAQILNERADLNIRGGNVEKVEGNQSEEYCS